MTIDTAIIIIDEERRVGRIWQRVCGKVAESALYNTNGNPSMLYLWYHGWLPVYRLEFDSSFILLALL